ncbi:g13145 [Coccomyxa viridis]|uniref:G13145 protein n=1 Tax=Coccomyxa viridis TaxID=1274662 RepID=A0ABP1GC39_9CHLO
MAAKPLISLDIWSDLACPWCYVGKRRLDKALAVNKERANFKIQWHPYMIDPATKPAGEDYMAYNRRRWGSDGWTRALKESGRPDGANFANWQTWPNTLQGHRLVLLAEKEGKASQAEERLFEAIYEKGLNISDISTLEQIGEELQLPEVKSFLQSSEGKAKVLQRDREAKQQLNIHGVPHFLVGAADRQERTSLHGAQSTAALSHAIRQAAA